MRKRMMLCGFAVPLVWGLSVTNAVYAGEKAVASLYEPMGYALLFAGGVTIVAIRRWKSRRNSKLLFTEKEVLEKAH